MKKFILFSILMLVLFSCKMNNVRQTSDVIIIINQESNDGRPMFTVKLPDGTVRKHFYAEEIAHSLLTGTWENDENIRLAYASEYQVNLEPDSIMVYDFGRKVAAVPYAKAGILDSIFIKDNE